MPAVDKQQDTAQQDHIVTLDDIRPGWFGASPRSSHFPANSGKSLSSMEAKTHRWDLLSLHTVTPTYLLSSAKLIKETMRGCAQVCSFGK